MADRYWRGGTDSWDGTAGTKWADSVGGAGGASVPTSADDVYFDATSTGTVTIATGNTGAKSINCTGFTGTLTGLAAITVSGSVTLVAGMTYSHTGTMTFNGTGTLTTAGKTFSGVTVDGSGITLTLGDALDISSRILTVTQGTFTTANFNVTAGTFSSSNTNTRTITLGSSTLTLSTSTALNFATSTNLTFNANTSQINCTFSGANFSGGGQTFYNVSWTNLSISTLSINNSNTFNNLSFVQTGTTGVTQVEFTANQTINGQLSTSGTAGNLRVWFRSDSLDTIRTLTINGSTSLTDADFRDITVAGTAAPISGTRIGNLTNNSGITFSTPKTVYWNLAGAQFWSANGWSNTSTGTPSTDYFPLAQDTATFTNAGSVTGTITINNTIPYTGTVDMSGRTSAMTLAINAGLTVYGDWKNGSGTTLTASGGSLGFSGRNTQNITSAGKTFPCSIFVTSIGGTVQLADALSIAAGSNLVIQRGTFTTANFNITGSQLESSATATRTITLGSSTVTLSSVGTAVNFLSSTNLTFNANTSQITCSGSGASFAGGGQTFYNVSFTNTGSGTISISGANTFNNLTFTTPASLITPVQLSANQTVSGTLTLGAANTAIRRIFVRSDTVGTQRTITLNGSLATLADVDFRDINAAGTVATPWTGTRIGDCKGNNNITFTAAKTVYWNLAGTQNWSATGWATTNNGTPAVNNFPLAQDTAVFTEAGAAGTVTINGGWNIGTIQMADGVSNRTTAFTLASGTTTPSIYGNVTLFSSLTLTGTGAWTFAGQGTTQTITSAGITFTQSITVNSPSGTFQLADNLTNTGTSFTLTSGTLDLSSGNRTLSVRTFVSNNSNTRAISFGSGSIALTSTTAAATVLSMATATNFTWTGTGAFTRNMAATATVNFGTTAGGTTSNAPNLTVNAGSSALTISSGSYFNNVDFTGSTSTVSGSYNACGNLTLASGGTYTSVVPTFLDSGTITSTGKTLGSTTVNGSGITVTLADDLTLGSTNEFTLTAGTLDLSSGNRTLSTGLFTSNISNTRSIAFGTGQITATGNNASIWSVSAAANFSYTGTSKVVCNYSGSTGTRTIIHGTTGGTEANAVSFYITAGTDTIDIPEESKTIDFTGFAGTFTNDFRTIYGNLIISSGMTLSAGTGLNTFAATSGTQQITTAGKTLDFPITINAPGATVSFVDAFTMGSTRTLTFTNGTLDANNQNVSIGLFSSSNSNTRTLTMGSGSWTITGTGSVWNITNSTNLTLNKDTANITLSDTSSSARTFAGGGKTYNNLVIGGTTGTSTLTFTGSNTFGTISSTKTVAHTISFTNGTTTTVSDWTVTGTSGNVVTINSTSPGSQATLSKSSGSVTTNFMNITDSNATGGARWVALNSINGGNNSGWLFGAYNISGDNGLLFFP